MSKMKLPVSRRIARYTGFVFLQLFLVLLLLEIAGRVIDPLGISYYPEIARYFDSMIIEEPIGYRNRPLHKGTYYGHPVEINSFGMRDREVSAPEKDEFRILVMGDSVPFGLGVRYEESFPYVLENELNATRTRAGKIRTLNMGVPSYNTEQELVQLETVGLTLQPQLVVLLFSINDIEPKMWVFDKRRNMLRNLAQRSYAMTLLFVLYRDVILHRLASMPFPSTSYCGVVTDSTVNVGAYQSDHPQWLAIDRSLSSMNKLLKSRNLPFILFTREEPEHVMALLRGVAKREGFPMITLKPYEDPRWRGDDPMKYVNSPVDLHPNAAGNKILAILMAEAIRRAQIPGLP